MQGDAVRIFLVAGSPPVPYERGLHAHSVVDDGDCLDARQEVLMAESRTPARLDPTGCRVAEGLWRDPFADREIPDSSALDVDHLVPLAEAHRSGASGWTPEEQRQHANDLMHPDAPVAVAAEANRSKGDGDPAHWLPPVEDQRCGCVRKWVPVKATWGLDMDAAERGAVRDVLRNCDTESERLPGLSGGPCTDVNTASAQQLQAVRSIGGQFPRCTIPGLCGAACSVQVLARAAALKFRFLRRPGRLAIARLHSRRSTFRNAYT